MGDYQGAVDLYFHADKPTSRQMQDGKDIHEQIANHIKETNNLPTFLNFNYTLMIPEPEKSVVVTYNELCDLKAVFDCLDEPTLFEWKTGVSDSLEWARTFQIPMYFLIAELAKIKIDKAYLVRYNQYTKESDYSIVHNTPKQIEEARNVIDSVVYPIHKYFSEVGYI
jgi:hypothetical protein